MADGTNFGVGAQLTVTVDSRSLAEARAEIEDEIGDVTVGVGNGAGGALAADGGVGGSMIDDAAMVNELSDQTELLEDIYDELDGMAGMGAGAGGGGGGGFASDIASTAAGYGLVRGLAGWGALGSGSTLALGAAGTAGLAGGLGGVEGLKQLGIMEGVADQGQNARQDLPYGRQIGDALQFTPGLSLGAFAAGGLDFDQGASNFAEVQSNRGQVLENVSDSGRSPGALSLFSDDTIQKTLRKKVRSGEISEDRAQEMADKYGVELTVSEDARETAQQWRQAAKEFQNLDISAPPWMSQLGRLFGIDIGGGGGGEDSPGAEPTQQMKDDARRIAASPGTAAEKRHAAMWVGDQPETGSNPETRRIMRSASTAAEKRHAAGWANQQSTDNRAAEKRQQGQRVDVSVANEIKPELQLRNGRELEQFLRNPERYISRKLNIRGRR